jgi:LPXTG-motif cell wall-anchored protein
LKKLLCLVLVVIFVVMGTGMAYAHSGGLDSLGGHYVRKPGKGFIVGTYHYHQGKYAGWIVTCKGDVPDPKLDKFECSIITDDSSPIITPIPSLEPASTLVTTSPITMPQTGQEEPFIIYIIAGILVLLGIGSFMLFVRKVSSKKE